MNLDQIFFPFHRSQNNNHRVSFHDDVDAGDQGNISTLVAPQDPHQKLHDPDSTNKRTSGKKPRYRHSLTQLAVLDEPFEKNEHPNLDNRNELAGEFGTRVLLLGTPHDLY
jgi:hypothetical protein